MRSVKELAESSCLTSVPSEYVCLKSMDCKDSILSESETIPIIDFSQLTSPIPNQRSKAIQQLAEACRDWGFFVLINHGMSETLRDKVIRATHDFFDLPEDEKREYIGGQFFDPIRYGTSFNLSVDKTLFWRDYLKIHTHPPCFHAPTKPPGFSDILDEYCKKSKEVIGELLKGISLSLGLDENYIHKRLNLESGSQLLVMNLYPPCPKPEATMGLPAHTDYGLLTLLMENVGGLQIQYNGKWIPVYPLPNSFLVNTGDHMEILTNGKYKSVVHQAVVNKEAERISIGTTRGPPLDTIVSPAPELLSDGHPPAYCALSYREYIQIQQSHPLDGKSCLDRIRL